MPSILTLTIVIVVCWTCYRLTSGRTAAPPKFSAEGDNNSPNDPAAIITSKHEMTLTATVHFGGDPQRATGMLVDGNQTTGEHYVYVHKGVDGEVFYVGKGVGNRAYSKDRMPHWHQYVKTRCGGEYTVEIVRHFQNDEAALELKAT